VSGRIHVGAWFATLAALTLVAAPLSGCGGSQSNTSGGSTSNRSSTSTGTATPPTPRTARLEDWHGSGKTVGTAELAPAPSGGTRLTLDVDVSPDAYPLRVTVYGGQTPGVDVDATTCDVVYNNTLYQEAGGSNRSDLDNRLAIVAEAGEFASGKGSRLIPLADLLAADSIAVWGFGGDWMVGCGDV
jgi:hypothetical protein